MAAAVPILRGEIFAFVVKEEPRPVKTERAKDDTPGAIFMTILDLMEPCEEVARFFTLVPAQ